MKEFKGIESIQRGQNLYTDYTVVRIENSTPLFIKDVNKEVYNELVGADIKKITLILQELGSKVLKGNPNTEKETKRVLKPAPKPKKK